MEGVFTVPISDTCNKCSLRDISVLFVVAAVTVIYERVKNMDGKVDGCVVI